MSKHWSFYIRSMSIWSINREVFHIWVDLEISRYYQLLTHLSCTYVLKSTTNFVIMQMLTAWQWPMAHAGILLYPSSTSASISSTVHQLTHQHRCPSGTNSVCYFMAVWPCQYRRWDGCIMLRWTPTTPLSLWTGHGQTSFWTGPMVSCCDKSSDKKHWS